MPTISIGGVDYEVYADLAEANSYFATVVHGAPWAAASASTRNQALITATNVFERTPWQGAPTEPIDKDAVPAANTQPLAWPRSGLTDFDGVAVDETEIPWQVPDGAMEYALAVINDATVQSAVSSGSNVQTSKLTQRVEGAVTVSTETGYFQPTLKSSTRFPTIIHELIGFWLSSTQAPTVPLASGTDVESGAAEDWGTGAGGWP